MQMSVCFVRILSYVKTLNKYRDIGILYITLENLAQQFEGMLYQSLKTVDKYVDALCIRVSYLGNEIPQHRKDKAIIMLTFG